MIFKESWAREAESMQAAMERLCELYSRGHISAEEFANKMLRFWNAGKGKEDLLDRSEEGTLFFTSDWIYANSDVVSSLHESLDFLAMHAGHFREYLMDLNDTLFTRFPRFDAEAADFIIGLLSADVDHPNSQVKRTYPRYEVRRLYRLPFSLGQPSPGMDTYLITGKYSTDDVKDGRELREWYISRKEQIEELIRELIAIHEEWRQEYGG